MSLVYVTGICGAGKSAAMREMKNRGFEAYGVDEDGYADWVNRESGHIAELPADEAEMDMYEWYRHHRWMLSEERIRALYESTEQASTTGYLFGVAEGENRVWPLFSRAVALLVDEATLRERIERRTDNMFGKNENEMADIVSWLQGCEEKYRRFGAVVINAMRPLDDVVNDILSVSGNQMRYLKK